MSTPDDGTAVTTPSGDWEAVDLQMGGPVARLDATRPTAFSLPLPPGIAKSGSHMFTRPSLTYSSGAICRVTSTSLKIHASTTHATDSTSGARHSATPTTTAPVAIRGITGLVWESAVGRVSTDTPQPSFQLMASPLPEDIAPGELGVLINEVADALDG